MNVVPLTKCRINTWKNILIGTFCMIFVNTLGENLKDYGVLQIGYKEY